MPTVEIWSDIACPWCAIGRVRLQEALALLDAPEQVAVRWRSFELDPAAPPVREGSYVRMLSDKYRTADAQAQAMIDRMVQTAADAGLSFDFGIIRPGNTFDAHRVLHLAADRGVQDAVKARFFEGYLGEGAAIGDPAVVQGLAGEAGLDEVEVKEVLAGDAYADAVRADEAAARDLGIGGVPFYVVDRQVGVSGAQPAEVIAEAIRKVWPAQPLDLVGDATVDGDACGIDGC